ncbi:uncharacterized protein [Nicotiana tomentosiformis]|uniref:uncharacterized protein n=1 Tax=Nicotiana tomentosiformis TaxID=4098 RepID=UPI00388C4443
MAKTSQTIPQKEKISSLQCVADETPVEPRPEEDEDEEEEEEEEEENNESALAVRTKKATDASSPAGSMMLYEAPPRTEDIPEKYSGRVPELSDVEDASHQSQPAAAVHREQCSRSQNELHRYASDLHRATDERNSLRLSLGQREEEIKDLRAEMAKAY